MATESPMRIVESSRGRHWPPLNDAAIIESPFKNMVAGEYGSLLKGHNIYRDQRNTMPNRSGSAPPSMEGSLAAIGNLLAQQDSTLNPTLASLSSVLENCESEEQLRSDPAYFSYYLSNVNLNPRLPPPLMSRENCRLVRHIGGFNNNWRLASLDDSEYLHLSQSSSLSTHNEEPEDESSAEKASNKLEEDTNELLLGQCMASTTSHHKSLVDLIQQDFPRTPSPLYNQTLSSSRSTTDEAIDRDVHALSLNVSSSNISKLPKPNPGPAAVCLEINPLNVHVTKSLSDNIPLISSFFSQQCSVGSRIPRTDKVTNSGVRSEDDVESCTSQSQFRSRASNIEVSGIEQEEKSYGRNMTHRYMSAQRSAPYQHPSFQSSVILQGKNHLPTGMENISQGHTKVSSVDVQPQLHSPSLPPFLYATSAAYMTPGSSFYPSFQPIGLYAPQYNVGGYALGSTHFPPFMPEYTSRSALPMPFDATSGPSFNARTSGVSIAESVKSAGDLQNLGKLYGQSELIFHPSFLDPLNMQYFPRPLDDPYGAVFQFGQLASRGVSQIPINPFVSQSEASINTYLTDQKIQSATNILSIPSPRRVGNDNYYGNTSNMGIITQFPVSPHASPALPSSPVSGMTYFGRRNEVRFSQGSVRTAEPYSGWINQKGVNSCDETKRHSFLEELKSSSSRKFELSDIVGRIVEFSIDQHGSRFIQQKLEICSPEEKASIFKEVLPNALKLMTDVFGNYVIQKFFEYGTPEQRAELAHQLSGQMLPLSLQMYGCRVIQKALEVIELDQKTVLIGELDGHVMRCVHDQNGNHVIQKCIECVPTQSIEFIISSFRGQVATLSTHPYGCRVIQRVLEHCSDEKACQCIIDEILESACVLAQDQYGNYVTQHVLERGKSHERSQIIEKLFGKVLEMSQHKYASNVVEKCLEHGNTTEQELLIEEIIGQSEENDNLLTMMKDQFANYVVQKILETSNDKQREIVLSRIRAHLHGLKKYTYGKHIVARFEQLAGEGEGEGQAFPGRNCD